MWSKTFKPHVRGANAVPITLLYIDDDVLLLRLMKKMLARDNYTIHEATDGYKGLEMAALHKPDIIFLDISMPGIDGVEVVRRLRQTPATQKTPVIAVSAHVQPNERGNMLEQGFDLFLPKPVTRKDLVDTITRLVQSKDDM
jgi:CheY-like chemotaxis protein